MIYYPLRIYLRRIIEIEIKDCKTMFINIDNG
jgi:hypothetical protein